MGKTHKHQALIDAHASGAEIEYRSLIDGRWEPCPRPGFFVNYEYRIKPTELPGWVSAEQFSASLPAAVAAVEYDHTEVKKAFEGGLEIEVRAPGSGVWGPASTPQFYPSCEYRVKPRDPSAANVNGAAPTITLDALVLEPECPGELTNEAPRRVRMRDWVSE